MYNFRASCINLILCYLLILPISQVLASTTNVDDPFNRKFITELLCNESDNRAIFTCEIIDIYKRDGRVFHTAVTIEKYKGVVYDTISLYVLTDPRNCDSMVGESSLAIGTRYLVVGQGSKDRFSYNRIHSFGLTEKMNNPYLSLLSDFYRKAAIGYSGPYRYDCDGKLIISGLFKNGLADGKWTHTSLAYDTMVITTHYLKGQLHGAYSKKIIKENYTKETPLIKYAFGKVIYRESWRTYRRKHLNIYKYSNNGTEKQRDRVVMDREGNILAKSTILYNIARFNYLNEEILDGEFRNKHGLLDHEAAEGTFYRGAKVGLWTYFSNEGTTIDSTVTYEKPIASKYDYSVYHPNGVIALEGNLAEKVPHGKWTQYDKEGALNKVIEYKRGKFTGTIIDSDGGQQEYIDNMKNGVTKIFYSNGNVKRSSMYQLDTLNGWIKKYFKSGQQMDEINYLNGCREGLARCFFESGQLRSEVIYIDGNRTGPMKRYYENGQIMERYSYDHRGARVGSYERFDTAGKLVEEGVYVSGYEAGVWKRHLDNDMIKERKYPDQPHLEVETHFAW